MLLVEHGVHDCECELVRDAEITSVLVSRRKATTALKWIPARLRRDGIHPGATRAKLRIERSTPQMVCRLLAHNAEFDLARKLNAYVCDDDEYRGIARNLLHLGGGIDCW
jgi:hypothetical protein